MKWAIRVVKNMRPGIMESSWWSHVSTSPEVTTFATKKLADDEAQFLRENYENYSFVPAPFRKRWAKL